MKNPLLSFLGLFVIFNAFAAPPPAPPTNARTILNLPDFPLAVLKTSLNQKLYKSLIISPVTAWVVVQVSSQGAAPKMIHSEAGGAFDSLALSMAQGWAPVGYNTTESRMQSPTLKMHLVIYKLVDGLMAVNFAHNDQAFYAGLQHTEVWVGVFKNGKWTRVGGTKIIRP